MKPAIGLFSLPKQCICLVLIAALLGGCAGVHPREDNAIGGVMVGAALGGAVGALCCSPVAGLPAGILIGGIAGGATGLLMPPMPAPPAPPLQR